MENKRDFDFIPEGARSMSFTPDRKISFEDYQKELEKRNKEDNGQV